MLLTHLHLCIAKHQHLREVYRNYLTPVGGVSIHPLREFELWIVNSRDNDGGGSLAA